MADYFLDSSAVVKRYINELGSGFVDRLVDPENGDNVFLAQITRVEVASAFARRKKGKTLTDKDAAAALASFTVDLDDIYLTLDITTDVVAAAALIATKHAVRGYDAVQLAAALAANHNLTENGYNPLTFVSADGDLNSTAIAEGLGVVNPNDHDSNEEL